MGSHPINLVIRFLLELIALTAMGIWGWTIGESWLRFVLLVMFPLCAAVVWGTFAVPNDPSRSGAAPVEVPGWLRLAIELIIFAFATWIFFDLNYHRLFGVFGLAVLIHYIVSYDRIIWLLSKKS